MKDKKTLKSLLKRLKKYRASIVISLVLSVFAVGCTLYIPIIVGRAIDNIVSENNVNFPEIIKLLTRAVVAITAVGLFQWIMNTINNKITYNTVRDIRNDAIEKIEKLPIKYIDTHPHGDLVSRVIADVDRFADGLLMGFTQLFSGVLTIVGTLGFMLSLNVKIALVVVILTPLSLFAAAFIAKHTHDMFMTQSKTQGKQTAYIDEIIGNQKIVKAFSRESRVTDDFDKINDEYEKCSLKAVFFSSLTNPTTRFVNNVVYAAVALMGAISVIGGGITVGGLVCFLSYANQYTKPFNEISGVVTELQNAIVCAKRIFELIDEAEETDVATAELKDVSGNIEFENVCFSYSENKKLIENINLRITSGQTVAIVGPTGCGKTTIINLLMRFYDTDSGAIKIDGTDIKKLSRKNLRSCYGMVLQETWLKCGSVRDNIKMSKLDATDEEVVRAAKASYAHSFIKRLPNGYDTIISDDGSNLSEGQRQLLCIARIMLASPPILILDEATSSIDTRTELKIQKTFDRLTENKTSFIVAHRLSTIKEASIILVMESGKIVEVGNHNELIKKKGFYYKLYNSQFIQKGVVA